MRPNFLTLAIATTVPALTASTTMVQAQQDAAASRATHTLEEVIVMARRRAEGLQDVPVAVTPMSAEALEARNVVNFDDLQALGRTFHWPVGASTLRLLSPPCAGSG